MDKSGETASCWSNLLDAWKRLGRKQAGDSTAPTHIMIVGREPGCWSVIEYLSIEPGKAVPRDCE